MAMLRMFVSIRPDAPTGAALARLRQRLIVRVPFVRWSRPDHLHLTLKFLGDVDEERIPELIAALRNAVAGTKAFALSAEGLGAFPSLDRPNVIWAGIHGDLDALATVQKRIEFETRSFAAHDETRPFHAHLTLGRLKNFRQKQRVSQALKEILFDPLPPWTVHQVELFKSDLTPQGPIHTKLATARFTDDSETLNLKP